MPRLYALADVDGNIVLSDKRYRMSQGAIIFSDDDPKRLRDMMKKLASNSRVPGMSSAKTAEQNAAGLHKFRELVRGDTGYDGLNG